MRLLHKVCLICFVFGTLSSFSSALAETSALLKLIPNDNEIAGWSRDGKAFIALEKGALFDFINGGAPFYIERGVVEAVFQDYIRKDLNLSLEIYRTKDAENTKKIYADIYVEDPEILNDVGTAGRFVGNLVGVYMIEYYEQSFFVRLIITEKSAASKKAIFKFAWIVSEKIHKHKL